MRGAPCSGSFEPNAQPGLALTGAKGRNLAMLDGEPDQAAAEYDGQLERRKDPNER
jgi:hypothetical protein